MYKPDANTDADCLSHAPVAPPYNDLEEADFLISAVRSRSLAIHERSDPTIAAVFDSLDGKALDIPKPFRRSASALCIRNDVLHKQNFRPNKMPYLIVVPADLHAEILQACHDEGTSGHLGIARTLSRIQKKYYWPRLSSDVTCYVRTCRECERRKTPSLPPAGILKPIAVPLTGFQKMGMDMLGPFPLPNSGNKWNIVATDYLTRYAETAAIPIGTAD